MKGSPEVYRKKYPIQDCRGGQCFPGYFYYNGYITARQVNAANGVTGLPQNYTAFQAPINPAPAAGTVNANFDDTNNVNVRLNNGQELLVGLDTGLHPLRARPWRYCGVRSRFELIFSDSRLRPATD